jgi:hypothetical protein
LLRVVPHAPLSWYFIEALLSSLWATISILSLSLQPHLYVEGVRDVIAAAVTEAKVEASLALIEGAWEHHRLQCRDWGETGVGLPVAAAATVEQLEDHQAQLQATHGAMRAATVSGLVNTASTDFFKSEVVQKSMHQVASFRRQKRARLPQTSEKKNVGSCSFAMCVFCGG